MAAVRIVGREAAATARILKLHLLAFSVVAAAVAGAATGPWFSEASSGATAPDPPPPAVDEPAAGYAFEATDGGDPVRFDPCSPLSVRYEPAGEPYPAAADVAEAVRSLSTGMGRPIGFQTGGAVDGAEITVTWVPRAADLPGTPDEQTVGTGGFSAHGGTITSGTVTLAADGNLSPGFDTRSWGAVYLHELGHAVGLDHVPDPAELMHPTVVAGRVARYGAGDLAGLALVGGPCAARG